VFEIFLNKKFYNIMIIDFQLFRNKKTKKTKEAVLAKKTASFISSKKNLKLS